MKKFNPEKQIKLDLFPIEGVVVLNAAAIRDFKKAYWEHTNAGLSIRDNISEAFIWRLACDAAKAKTALREMMVRSEHWRESLQAWVIPFEVKIPVTKKDVARMVLDMWDDWRYCDGLTYDGGTVRQAVDYFLPRGTENPENVNAVEKILGRPPRGKLSKVFKKVSTALGVYTTERGSVYQKLEAQLFTALAAPFENGAFQVTKHDVLYVSLNPAHWLSMSNPKGDNRGELMTSCHSLNGHYHSKSGCVGYARDETSLIAFTAANGGDALLNRKTARQVFMYQNGALLQSRLYTSNTNESYGGVYDGGHWENDVFLKVIQAEIARCEKARGGWSNVTDYRKKEYLPNSEDGIRDNPDNRHELKLNDFGVEVFKARDFGGYPDWEYFANYDGMIRVAVLKRAITKRGYWKGNSRPIIAGATGLSVRTGNLIDSDDSITA